MHHRSFFFILGTAIITAMFLVPAHTAKAARLYTNTNPLFEACLQRCEEQTPLGELTKRGCYKGCAEIRRSFTISESYRSMASCIEDMNDLELEKDLVIEKYQAWCDKQWPHLHKRKGCKDAVEVYIRAATVNSICYHQSPKAIAKQTPRTTMTTRYPAVTTHSTGHPAPAPATIPPLTSTDGFQGSSQTGDVLSMPPVYDTPKYSSPATGTKQGVKPAPKRTTPAASSSAGKAPSLTSPASPASPTSLAPSKQAGTTAPPKSGTTPDTTRSGSTAQSQSAKAVPAVPVVTPSTAVAPVRPVTQTTETVNASPPPIQDSAGSSAPAPLPASTPVINAATTPVINAATAPTAPPVIAPPAPIMSDFTATPSPPVSTQTPSRIPSQSSTAGQRVSPTSGPALGPAPGPALGQTPDLLPPLQRPNLQQSGSQQSASPQMDQQQTHGIDTPMPAPIPAPTT